MVRTSVYTFNISWPKARSSLPSYQRCMKALQLHLHMNIDIPGQINKSEWHPSDQIRDFGKNSTWSFLIELIIPHTLLHFCHFLGRGRMGASVVSTPVVETLEPAERIQSLIIFWPFNLLAVTDQCATISGTQRQTETFIFMKWKPSRWTC